jgi:hypothetical protein
MLARGNDRADQACGDVLLADPGVQVGVVDQGRRHDLGVGVSHHAGHVATDTLELLRLAAGGLRRRRRAHRLAGQRGRRALRFGLRQRRRQMATGGGWDRTCGSGAERGRAVGGSVLDVLHGDHAIGTAGAHACQVDLQLLGQCTHRGYGFHAADAGGLFDVHVTAADHRADHGAFVFAILAAGFDFTALVGNYDLAAVIGCRAADAFLRSVLVAGVLRLGTLPGVRIGFELGQRRTGIDDVTRRAVQLGDLAGVRRGHIDDRLGGFHRAQRCIELDGVAHLHVPLDDGCVGQAFAEVGEIERLDISHGIGSVEG